MKTLLTLGAVVLLCAAVQAAPPAKPIAEPRKVGPVNDDGTPWPEAYFEIFKLAPGKQEAFIRDIARADVVSAAGGQPPIQMFVHQDGADWDVLLFKPERAEKPTATQQAAMDAKSKELQIESGPAYFVNIRQNIAAHTDTKTYGPLAAAQWLARLDAWRAAHPDAVKNGDVKSK